MRAFLALTLAIAALPVMAQPAGQTGTPPAPYAYTQLEDPALEAAATELMHTLRCLTCQSQSIADSDAPMAGDMRHQVRVRIAEGQNADEIRGWLVERYGDYVSYSPQAGSSTWPLFAVPLAILLIAGLVLVRRLRRRRSDAAGADA